MNHQVRITYCPGCNWLPRSCWMAQELLYTFAEEPIEVTLMPERDEKGTFRIELNENLVWCRSRDGGFPDAKTLKQRIRDLVNPERDLGHAEA